MVNAAGLDIRRIRFGPEQKLRRCEDKCESVFNADLEVPVLAARLIETQQNVEVGIRQRLPICASRECSKDFFCARNLVRRGGWMTSENSTAAGSVTRGGRIE